MTVLVFLRLPLLIVVLIMMVIDGNLEMHDGCLRCHTPALILSMIPAVL